MNISHESTTFLRQILKHTLSYEITFCVDVSFLHLSNTNTDITKVISRLMSCLGIIINVSTDTYLRTNRVWYCVVNYISNDYSSSSIYWLKHGVPRIEKKFSEQIRSAGRGQSKQPRSAGLAKQGSVSTLLMWVYVLVEQWLYSLSIFL